MTIIVVGPLPDQMRHIEKRCKEFLPPGCRLAWLDKDYLNISNRHFAGAAGAVVMISWTRHYVQTAAINTLGRDRVIIVDGRGQSSAVAGVRLLCARLCGKPENQDPPDTAHRTQAAP